jgi:hypothetical protein
MRLCWRPQAVAKRCRSSQNIPTLDLILLDLNLPDRETVPALSALSIWARSVSFRKRASVR